MIVGGVTILLPQNKAKKPAPPRLRVLKVFLRLFKKV